MQGGPWELPPQARGPSPLGGIYNRGALFSIIGQCSFRAVLPPAKTSDTHRCLFPVEPRRNQGKGLTVCPVWADARRGGQKDHRRGNGVKSRLCQPGGSEGEASPACVSATARV